MVLEDVFTKETVIVDLESTEKDELFEEMVEALHSVYPEIDRAEAIFALNDRESKMSTGIMHSVAVPHAVVPSLKGLVGAIGISRKGIGYDSLDKAPVYIVFMILAGEGQTEKHVQILKSLAVVLQKPGFVEKLSSCSSAADVYNLIIETEHSA